MKNCPQTTAPAGKRGKLVTLGSRKELDCLVQFINDEFKEPAFEVKTNMSKYKDRFFQPPTINLSPNVSLLPEVQPGSEGESDQESGSVLLG